MDMKQEVVSAFKEVSMDANPDRHNGQEPEIELRLKQLILNYKKETGSRLTYRMISDKTGISLHTIQSMATRKDSVPSLRNVARLCSFFGCDPGALLHLREAKDTQP